MPLLIFICFVLIFYISYGLGTSLSEKYLWISKIGKKIYADKIGKLKTSPLFSSLRKAIKTKSIIRAFVFIFPLILIKSIAFCFIALFLVAPLILIFQGIAMGSLISYYNKNVGCSKALKLITFWQLLSHIIGATIGTLLGLKWLIYKEVDLNFNLLFSNETLIYVILITLTAMIAAYLESKSLIIKNE